MIVAAVALSADLEDPLLADGDGRQLLSGLVQANYRPAQTFRQQIQHNLYHTLHQKLLQHLLPVLEVPQSEVQKADQPSQEDQHGDHLNATKVNVAPVLVDQVTAEDGEQTRC